MLLLSSAQRDTEAKLMECQECLQQEKEDLQSYLKQLQDETLSKMFSRDAEVKSVILCVHTNLKCATF